MEYLNSDNGLVSVVCRRSFILKKLVQCKRYPITENVIYITLNVGLYSISKLNFSN